MKKILLLCILLISFISADILKKKDNVRKKIVTLKNDNNLQVIFEHASPKNAPLTIAVFDKNKKNHFEISKGYDVETKHIYNIPLKKGKYIVLLFSKDSTWYYERFTFKTKLLKGNFEKEGNNTFEESTHIKSKNITKGYLQTSKYFNDEDFYKISLKNNSLIELAFFNKSKNKDTSYDLVLYNKNKKELFSYSINKNKFDKKVGLKKGSYYIKISTKYSELKNKEYKLAYLNLLTKSEFEPNNSIPSANILLNNTYHLATSRKFDKDFYEFNLKNVNKAKISIRSKYFRKGDNIRVTLYNASHAPIKVNYINGKKYNELFIFDLEKGKYFLGIENLRDSNKEYNLSILTK